MNEVMINIAISADRWNYLAGLLNSPGVHTVLADVLENHSLDLSSAEVGQRVVLRPEGNVRLSLPFTVRAIYPGADIQMPSNYTLAYQGLRDIPVIPEYVEVKNLVIEGSRDKVTLTKNGLLSIGCQDHTIAHWMERYKQIGQDEDYSEEEIEEYYRYIQFCAIEHYHRSKK